MLTGVLPTVGDKQAIGGFKEGSNFGIDIGSAIAPVQTQVLSVRAVVINPLRYATPDGYEGLSTDPLRGKFVPGLLDDFGEDRYAGKDVTYEFIWACDFWALDAYRYWEPSDVFARSPAIVSKCLCGSESKPIPVEDNRNLKPTGRELFRCMAPWSKNASTPVHAAEASRLEFQRTRADAPVWISGKFENTFEFTCKVIERVEGVIEREAIGVARFTAYYQKHIDWDLDMPARKKRVTCPLVCIPQHHDAP
eukprot:122157-Rhodomonas_salina.1